jgi:tetratricopeptide (TPR) repeat protein
MNSEAQPEGEFGFVEQALIASGVTEEYRVRQYLHKLDQLVFEFMREANGQRNFSSLPEALFNWLWRKRPGRYAVNGSFRLGEVIDAEMSEGNESVGNCLGLTLLYNSLLRKIGIHAQALQLENAFGSGPHVLTVLRIWGTAIDIENILPGGFDFRGHKEGPYRLEWGDRELVADIYQSTATELFQKGQFESALRNYDIALKLNPEYEKARLNRAILLDRMAM